MAEKIVAIDYAGTFIKAVVIEEANELRSRVLERAVPSREEHAHPEALYEKNREKVEDLTGLTDEMDILMTENDGDVIEVPGEYYKNVIATNLFQLGMWQAAKKHGKSIVAEGFAEEVERIQSLGYKVAVVSGVRTDIISGMLQIAGVDCEFDIVLGQPPTLGISNDDQLAELEEFGELAYVIGDKFSDLEAGKSHGAQTVFATWGHPQGDEEAEADHTIDEPKDLRGVIVK